MGLFDVFKKKKPPKEEIQYVSYSHVTKDGQFMESYGYRCENTAKAFFDSLSQEDLDKLSRHKTNEVVQPKKYTCAKCKKELSQSETKWIAKCCFCNICASPRPKQEIISGIISERKKVNAVIRAISEMLSKQYYYITSANSLRDKNLVFILFLSRDRKTLLGIEATKNTDDICLTMDKTVGIPTEITVISLRELILSNFGHSIEETAINDIIQLIQSNVGYEFVPVLRFQDLFTIEEIPWTQQTTVGYDRVLGKPYLIERRYSNHRDSISATLITLKQVVDYAEKYASHSDFTTITDENWQGFINIDPNMIEESTTFCDLLLDGNDLFCVGVYFKEENGERLPLR